MTWKAPARMGSLVATVVSAGLLAAAPTTAAASTDYVSGSNGIDISWPQCSRPQSDLPVWTFSVVGVNGGVPFTMNPCFGRQYQWMRSTGFLNPSVYINLQYGEADGGYSSCAPADTACRAYDYGYLAAQYAYTEANYVTQGDTLAHAATWYLDIETMNRWSDNTNLNAAVIRGALTFLKATGKKSGVYSTAGQWAQIAGGYNPGSTVGNWVAGADAFDDASRCSSPLWAGGQVWLYQYLDLDLDLDLNHSC